MPRVRFPFLSKSFTEKDKSMQAGERGDRVRGEERRGEEHLGGQPVNLETSAGSSHLSFQAEDAVLAGHARRGAQKGANADNKQR